METYNGLEVNLAETAATDDSQEEIIVMDEYPYNSSINHEVDIQDTALQGNVLNMSDDSTITDSMLEEVEAASGPLGSPTDLVYTAQTAEEVVTGDAMWQDLQYVIQVGDQHQQQIEQYQKQIEQQNEQKTFVVVVPDANNMNNSGSGNVNHQQFQGWSGLTENVVVMPPQTAYVPEPIATETVITTQQYPSSDLLQQQVYYTPVQEESTLSQAWPRNDGGVLVSAEILYAESSLKDQKKRLHDRVKKQTQRQDPDYRARERIKSRERMKARRQDPDYREKEREKDRMRKEFIRKHGDPAYREREREKDRIRKGILRKQDPEEKESVKDNDAKISPRSRSLSLSKDVNLLNSSPFFDSVNGGLIELGGNTVT